MCFLLLVFNPYFLNRLSLSFLWGLWFLVETHDTMLASKEAPALASGDPEGGLRELPRRMSAGWGWKLGSWVDLHGMAMSLSGCGSKNRYPKWNPGKWKHGLKPAVPWWISVDPYPNKKPLEGGE